MIKKTTGKNKIPKSKKIGTVKSIIIRKTKSVLNPILVNSNYELHQTEESQRKLNSKLKSNSITNFGKRMSEMNRLRINEGIRNRNSNQFIKKKGSKKSTEAFQISFFNREKGRMEKELIYGDKLLRFLYENKKGKFWSNLLSHGLFSKLCGLYQNTRLSKRSIATFVRKFNVDMDEFLPGRGFARMAARGISAGSITRLGTNMHHNHNSSTTNYSRRLRKRENFPYRSFNDFFIRKFRPGARSFVTVPSLMPAFAEGKYFAYRRMSDQESYHIKGNNLTISAMLQNSRWENCFCDGPMLIARLCPVDYHRFHFPDDGEIIDYYRLPGPLHSVNPVALRSKVNVLSMNERQVSILETKNFGKLAYIEVGALAVGKIKQTHPLMKPFRRGGEKGYFLFGGSTVILIGEANLWVPDRDLIEMTSKGIETFVRLGDRVAHQMKILSLSD